MGVYQKYRDDKGRPTGPWFVKYPWRRDPRTFKVVYRTQKTSHSKKLATRFFRRKQDEFFRRDQQGLAIEDPKPRIGFAGLMDWHLDQDVVKSKKSYNKDVQRAKVLTERFGHLIADEISQTQVMNYQAERQKETTQYGRRVRPATVNREIALMRRAYNLGMDENLVSRNPCQRIKMLKEKNVRDGVLTWDELGRLRGELSPVAERVVMTAYHTGMRQGEILGLTVSKVNLEERYIDLSEDDTKDHERRRVYFCPELRDILRECLEARERVGVAHEYVFVRKNGKPVRSIRTAFEGACKRAGLEDFHFHDLRHTYNTDMRRAGVHDSVIMQQTGHATMEMFLRYNTVDEQDGREAVRKREEYLKKERHECSLYAP